MEFSILEIFDASVAGYKYFNFFFTIPIVAVFVAVPVLVMLKMINRS